MGRGNKGEEALARRGNHKLDRGSCVVLLENWKAIKARHQVFWKRGNIWGESEFIEWQ
jgi:hypothetical protein